MAIFFRRAGLLTGVVTAGVLVSGALLPVSAWADDQVMSDGWVRSAAACYKSERGSFRRIASEGSIDTMHANTKAIQDDASLGVGRPVSTLIYNVNSYWNSSSAAPEGPWSVSPVSNLGKVLGYAQVAGGIARDRGEAVSFQSDVLPRNPEGLTVNDTPVALSRGADVNKSVFGRDSFRDGNDTAHGGVYSVSTWKKKVAGKVKVVKTVDSAGLGRVNGNANVEVVDSVGSVFGQPAVNGEIKRRLSRNGGKLILIGASQKTTREDEIDEMVAFNYVTSPDHYVILPAGSAGEYATKFRGLVKEIVIATSDSGLQSQMKTALNKAFSGQGVKLVIPKSYNSSNRGKTMGERALDVVNEIYAKKNSKVERFYISKSDPAEGMKYYNRADFLSNVAWAVNFPEQVSAFLFVEQKNIGLKPIQGKVVELAKKLTPGLIQVSGGLAQIGEDQEDLILKAARSISNSWWDTSSPGCVWTPARVDVTKERIAGKGSPGIGHPVTNGDILYYKVHVENKAKAGYTTKASFIERPHGLDLLGYCMGDGCQNVRKQAWLPIPAKNAFKYTERLAGGASVDYIIKARVNSPDGKVYNALNNNEPPYEDDFGRPNLKVVKRIKGDLIPGKDAVFSITVTNQSEEPENRVVARNVKVKDIPQLGSVQEVSFGDIDYGRSVSKDVTVRIPEDFSGRFTNKALVTSDNADPGMSKDYTSNSCSNTNWCSTWTGESPAPHFTVSKHVVEPAQGGVDFNGVVKYRVTVVNDGKVVLKNYRVFDKSKDGKVNIDEKISLNAGDRKVWDYQVKVAPAHRVEFASNLVNDVIVFNPKDPHYGDDDPNVDEYVTGGGCSYNNCANSRIVVNKPAVTVSKERVNRKAGVHDGVKVVWKVTVRNNGAGPAFNVRVNDAQATVKDGEPGQHTVVIDRLNAGEAREILFESTVKPGHNGKVSNRVTVTTDGSGDEPGADASDEDDSHVDVLKQYEGDGVFTIKVSNTGTSDSEALTVTDYTNIDGGFEVLSPGKGSWRGNKWLVGVLEPGESVTARVRVNTVSKPAEADELFNLVSTTNNGKESHSKVKVKSVKVAKRFVGGDFGSFMVWELSASPIGEGVTPETTVRDTLPAKLGKVELLEPSAGVVKDGVWVLPKGFEGTQTVKARVKFDLSEENLKLFRSTGVNNGFRFDTPFTGGDGEAEGGKIKDDSSLRLDLGQSVVAYSRGGENVYRVLVKNYGKMTSRDVRVVFNGEVRKVGDLASGASSELRFSTPFDAGKSMTGFENRAYVVSSTEPAVPSACVANKDLDSDSDRCDVVETKISPKVKVLAMVNKYGFDGSEPVYTVKVKNAGDVPVVNGVVKVNEVDHALPEKLAPGRSYSFDVKGSADTVRYAEDGTGFVDVQASVTSELVGFKGGLCVDNGDLDSDDDMCDVDRLSAPDKVEANKVHTGFADGVDSWLVKIVNRGSEPVFDVRVFDRLLNVSSEPEFVFDGKFSKSADGVPTVKRLAPGEGASLIVKSRRDGLSGVALSVDNMVYVETNGRHVPPSLFTNGIPQRDVCDKFEGCSVAEARIPRMAGKLPVTGSTAGLVLLGSLLLSGVGGTVYVARRRSSRAA